MPEYILRDPWFWAFLAAAGWGVGIGFVASKRLGRSLGLGIGMFILAEVPRIILPLGFVSQPRIQSSPWLIVIGAIIFVGSLFFGMPVFHIVPLTGPNRRELLRTNGLYSVVRHPLMLCDILWPLMFGSVIGILLAPVWLLLIWILTYSEEESLVREYGYVYREFQSRVPRLFPIFFSGKR